MIKAFDGEIAAEKAPDMMEFEKLLAKFRTITFLRLFSEFNPMCGMDERSITNLIWREECSNSKGRCSRVENESCVGRIQKAALPIFRAQPIPRSLGKINQMNSDPSKEQAILLDELAAIERSLEIFKGSALELVTSERLICWLPIWVN